MTDPADQVRQAALAQQFAHVPGRTVGRLMRSLALGEDREQAIAFAESQAWGDRRGVIEGLKANVGGSKLGDVPGTEAGADFIAAIRPYSVLGRLRLRLVPYRTRVTAFGTGVVAYRVGEKQAIPLSKEAVFGGVRVLPQKVAALTVITKELVENAVPGTDEAIAADLAQAVGAAEDAAFLTPGTTGSILNGAPTAASAGTSIANVDTDLQKAIDLLVAQGLTLSGAVWVMSVTAATKLATLRGSGGAPAYPDIGPDGGELLKLPVITSEGPAGYLALIAQTGILVGPARAEVTRSDETTLQMTDTPNSYPNGPVTPVSMFQTESVALKGVLARGWYARDGAAVYITGGNY